MRIEELGITPNFFISEIYLNQSDIIGKKKHGWVWIEENNLPLFPPLPYRFSLIRKAPVQKYWAGWPNNQGINTPFLDYQYIYDPKDFLKMEGGKWATFRKNSRKWANREEKVTYTRICDDDQAVSLMVNWITRNQKTVQDVQFIVDCILTPPTDCYIKYLYDATGKLTAINFADENYKYINYRFLICRREPFADEYARLCFYLDPYIQNKGKMVNDGGSLGLPGLEKFKDKLNPIEKNKIYSFNI